MKRLLLAVTCFVFLSAQTPLARDRFENLQVLGDIPQSQLIGTMAFMAGSLGVKCEFCHVAGDFPSDEKPQKKTARRMIRMAGEINTQFFHGERRVTCQTCHRGSNKPANRPTSEQAFWNVKPAPVVEPPPVAADVLAKYLRALGNDGAPSPFIAKVTTRWINGSGDPTDSSATISFESPERFRLEERDDTSETITIVNGDRASIRTGSEVRDATRAERGDAWRRVSAILPVVPDAASLMAMESERVEGKLAYVLESGSGAVS
jgi:hypothetical protein